MTLPDDKKRRHPSRDPQIIREELLRPSHYLGYDHDEMGCYFLGREAFQLAESEFRRAVWLNPYDATFKTHWAIAMIRLGRMTEARTLLEEVLRENTDNVLAGRLWDCYWPGEARPPSD